ncbi:MAG: hypothetical protein JXA50_06770 [Deltaproteobacteria bacterium]|nr:hypothetical protein [Deltaproteobacteria bacterium]
MHVKRRQVELAGACESPDEDKNNDDSKSNVIRIDHKKLTLHYRYADCEAK